MRRTPLRFVTAAVLAFSLAGAGCTEPQPYLSKATVSFKRLKSPERINNLDPSVTFVAGYEMVASGTSLFQGLSDLRVTAVEGGYHITGLSDFGRIVDFSLMGEGQTPHDSPLSITDLKDEAGLVFDLRSLSDSEDIALDGVTGDLFVSFERRARILRYPKGQTTQASQIAPIEGLPELPFNEGMEALTLIESKHLLVGVESGGFYLCDTMGKKLCRVVQSDGAPALMYKIVSLETLATPDRESGAQVLALYRYYDPFMGPRNIVVLMKWDGERLTTIKTLAKIIPPLETDNYEGVSAVATQDGYRLFLISDTLDENNQPHLLVFDWKPL